MKTATSIGGNRTGLATSPAMAAELVRATQETVPSTRGDARSMATVRIAYARAAEPAGTMPPPASLKEAAKAAIKAFKGQNATVFMDKLGERLAFERSGVRLYDALISKFDVFGTWAGGPTLADLEKIRADEREHFLLMKRTIERLGSDPTVVTPSANAQAVISKGLPTLLGDPRTDLKQGLEAVLVAELVDNDCWENLIDLARGLGQEAIAAEMDLALKEEQDHLRRVRRWLAASLSTEAIGGRSDALRGARGVPRTVEASGQARRSPRSGRRSDRATGTRRTNGAPKRRKRKRARQS
jgi:rubrerythrin